MPIQAYLSLLFIIFFFCSDSPHSNILSRIRGSVTNNNGFWILWMDLLTSSFTLTHNYNQLQQLTIWSRVRWYAPSEPLSSNGRLCGASMTAQFRRSGVMSQYFSEEWRAISVTVKFSRERSSVQCSAEQKTIEFSTGQNRRLSS
jgi:hypothetical protein